MYFTPNSWASPDDLEHRIHDSVMKEGIKAHVMEKTIFKLNLKLKKRLNAILVKLTKYTVEDHLKRSNIFSSDKT